MSAAKRVFAISILILSGFIAFYLWNMSQSIPKQNMEIQNGVQGIVTSFSESYSDIDDIYNISKSLEINKQLKELQMNNTYTFDKPLLIKNVYGTNECSYYIYFTSDEETYMEYTVSGKGIPKFTRTAMKKSKQKGVKEHEYQLIGFVPGVQNTLSMRLYRKDGRLYKKQVIGGLTVHTTNRVKIKLDYKDGRNKEPLSEGLFAMFTSNTMLNEEGFDVLCYDNEGFLRSVYPVKDYRAVRIIPYGDNILYAITARTIVMVSPIGQVIRTYYLGNYSYHHDYQYDKKTNSLYLLATDRQEPNSYIEDLVISLDLDSGEVKKIIDFKNLFSDVYVDATSSNDEDLNDKKSIDWIHINSLSFRNSSNEMIFSSRELSAIISIKNVLSKPEINYIIGDQFVLKGYKSSRYYLQNVNKDKDFVVQYGQHDVMFVEDSKLGDRKYYLTMFNNNAGWSNSRKQLDWSHLKNVGKGLYSKDKSVTSSFYQYHVDEKNRVFKLVKSFSVPYSGILSNAGYYHDNIIVSSGTDYTFGEYSEDGKLIRQFRTERTNFTYRVYKYDFL